MADIYGKATVGLQVTISLTEQEAGALDALFGYDIEAFLRTFYAKMGRSYLQPYEQGFRSLHEKRGSLKGLIARARDARKVFDGTHIAVEKKGPLSSQ